MTTPTTSDAKAGTEALREPTHLHRKSGHRVRVLGDGFMQSGNWIGDFMQCDGEYQRVSVDMARVVIYEHDGKIWVRPVEEFHDGRFEALPASQPEQPAKPKLSELLEGQQRISEAWPEQPALGAEYLAKWAYTFIMTERWKSPKEPVLWDDMRPENREFWLAEARNFLALYTAPPVSPDVAALQARISELETHEVGHIALYRSASERTAALQAENERLTKERDKAIVAAKLEGIERNDALATARKANTAQGAAEALVADMREALEQAEACMSIVEPRSDKAEYLRILGVVRAALSRLEAGSRSALTLPKKEARLDEPLCARWRGKDKVRYGHRAGQIIEQVEAYKVAFADGTTGICHVDSLTPRDAAQHTRSKALSDLAEIDRDLLGKDGEL